MPLLAVNAVGETPVAADGRRFDDALARALARLPEGAPIVVMTHGYSFSPTVPGEDPHRHILAFDADPACWKAVSWPRHMGFRRVGDAHGLAIALGWEARGALWTAYAEAARAGRALAHVLNRIAALRPGARVGVLAHSLGARVALQALPHLESPVLHRAVLLAAAEFAGPAARALDNPAGRAVQVVNVVSRENDLFDALLEVLMPGRRGASLGLGLRDAPAGWLDLQIDHDHTLCGLRALGHRIAPPTLRVCHWSTYLRPGVFGLYRAILRDGLPLDDLRRAAAPAPAPRWSRLFPARGLATPWPPPCRARGIPHYEGAQQEAPR